MNALFKMCSFCTTLQWEDANAKILQLAEGTDEIQFLLNGWKMVCDQLQARPDEDNNTEKKSESE